MSLPAVIISPQQIVAIELNVPSRRSTEQKQSIGDDTSGPFIPPSKYKKWEIIA